MKMGTALVRLRPQGDPIVLNTSVRVCSSLRSTAISDDLLLPRHPYWAGVGIRTNDRAWGAEIG